MRKYVIALILIVVGIKIGFDYIISDKFQAYADKTKAPWTCQVNMVLGQFMNLMSRYDRARGYFVKITQRCPETEIAIDAEFEIAKSLENGGHLREAIDAYNVYVEKYPNTRRSRLARKSAGMLQNTVR